VKLTKGQVRELEGARAALVRAHRRAYPVLRNVDLVGGSQKADEFDNGMKWLIDAITNDLEEASMEKAASAGESASKFSAEVDAVVEAFIGVPPALADPEG
jgi:hypothetical protein